MASFEELMKRNEKFVKATDKKRMAELCKGQKPHTIVLTCSDSRVVPEFIFGCGLGELFVVRVAGNVACDCDVLASLEYAAEHLGAKTLVVLGHTNCGAICSACRGGSEGEGNIPKLLCQVMPAVKKANHQPDKAIPENVKLQTKNMKDRSPMLSHAIREGKLRLVNALYDISTGEVKVLDA